MADGKNGEDCDGHGTHVTALAAGLTYGVAKNASVHIVRVLDCEGFGADPDIIHAMSWYNPHPPLTMCEALVDVIDSGAC